MRRPLLATLAVATIAAIAIGGLMLARPQEPTRDYVAEFNALGHALQPSPSSETQLDGWMQGARAAAIINHIGQESGEDVTDGLFNMQPLIAPADYDTPERVALANRGLDLVETAGVFKLTTTLRAAYFPFADRQPESLLLLDPNAFRYGHLRDLVSMLAAQCARELERGNPAAAVERYEEGLILSHAFAFQPTMVDRLVSITSATKMITQLRRGLAAGQLDAESLEHAAAATDRLLVLPPPTTWLEAERLTNLDMLREASAYKRARLSRQVNEYFDGATLLAPTTPAQRATDPDLIAAQKLMDTLLADERAFDRGKFGPPPTGRYMSAVDQMFCDLHATRILIALERHRLRTGAYPDTLDALVPTELPDLEPRPRASFPLVYRSTDEAFTLYSVGADGVDDGGLPHPENPHKALIPDGAGHDFVYR